jgi:hypothetical protein
LRRVMTFLAPGDDFSYLSSQNIGVMATPKKVLPMSQIPLLPVSPVYTGGEGKGGGWIFEQQYQSRHGFCIQI